MKKSLMLFVLVLFFLAGQIAAFEFCDDGVVGERYLRIISVDDMLKENSQEWVWHNSEQIEVEVRVENRGDESGDYTVELTFVEDGDEVNIAEDDDNLTQEISLGAGERESLSFEFQMDDNIDEGNYEVYVKFYLDGDEDEQCVENGEESINVVEILICDEGNVDEDELLIEGIEDNLKGNEDEWEWQLGDSISVTVEVSNEDYSERDFIVELVLLDVNGNEVGFAENEDDLEIVLELDEGEDDEVEFEFELSSNLTDEEYFLYARFYDYEDDDICTSLKAEDKNNPVVISIIQRERDVRVESLEGPNSVTEGEYVTYTLTVVNLGTKDENRVAVTLYNNLFSLSETVEIEDLLSKETRDVDISFTVPTDLNFTSNKFYLIGYTEYDYRESSETYKLKLDEDYFVDYAIVVSEESEEEEVEEYCGDEICNRDETCVTCSGDCGECAEENSSALTGDVVSENSGGSSFGRKAVIFVLVVVTLGIAGFFLRKKKISFHRKKNFNVATKKHFAPSPKDEGLSSIFKK